MEEEKKKANHNARVTSAKFQKGFVVGPLKRPRPTDQTLSRETW